MSEQMYSLTVDYDGIATVGFDLPGKVNIMNDDFMAAMPKMLRTLEAQRDELLGIVITSHKSTFFAGGDLALMRRARKGQEQVLFEHFELLKSFFRRLELMGLPAVAAINGTALGGGFELCLACHHRIALANPKTRIGLPEVNFGILPAAGGVIRLTAMLGLPAAFEFLLTGKSVDVTAALRAGLIDEAAETEQELRDRARSWIKINRHARQPWDIPGEYVRRDRPPATVEFDAAVMRDSGLAGRVIAEIATESLLRLDFEAASQMETRGFVDLLLTDEAQRRIAAFFEANDRSRSSDADLQRH